MMGINESFKKCLPKLYRPGEKYGRDELAKMFVCYTEEPKKFNNPRNTPFVIIIKSNHYNYYFLIIKKYKINNKFTHIYIYIYFI